MLSTTLILVLFSVIGIVLLFSLKIFEIKTGKSGIFSRVSITTDPILSASVDAGKRICRCANSTNIRKFLAVVTEKLFHVFGTAGLFVSKHYGRFAHWIKGRRYIKGGGIVSFFLKNVAESKEKKD